MLFSDKFPNTNTHAQEQQTQQQLNGYIDSAFYSHYRHKLYLLKGDDTYEGVGFSEYENNVTPLPRHNHTTLQYIDKWFNIWYDICEVSTTTEYVVQPTEEPENTTEIPEAGTQTDSSSES